MLALASVTSYQGYALFAWMYGFCLGGYQYALHQYTLDRVRARQFARGWSLVLAVRALPALFGIPITGIKRMNESCFNNQQNIEINNKLGLLHNKSTIKK
jgi:hypothetical protein